ncbi:MAG: ABC transporter permease subunit [Candidatus Dormibacteraeota bacterium]|nr:ABC transporter permease subunit [Candidatus Dormibacteraeota bacterium]
MPSRRAELALPQLLLGAILVVLLVYPMLTVVIGAMGAGGGAFERLLLAPGAGRAWFNTLWVSVAASTLAVLAGGLAVAATAGVRGPAAMAVRSGVILPLLVPPFASAVGWSQAYGPGGMTDAFFHLPAAAIIGPLGVVAATAAELMPVAFLVLVSAAVTGDDSTAVMAARASGSTRWSARLRVTLPLMRPAIAGAVALTFLGGVNNFTIPAVLGTPAGFETLTSRIYNDFNFATTPSAFAEAQVLAASLALVSLFILFPAARLVGTAAYGAAPGAAMSPRRGSRVAIVGVSIYLLAAVAAPILALVLSALTRAPGLLPVPRNWSAENFQQALAGPRFMPALINSVTLGATSATALVLLGLAVTAVERRRGGRVVAGVVTLGFAVPGSVVAVAILLAYGRWLGGSLLIILLAYMAKLWALAHRPLSGAARGLPPSVSLAARASGASGREVLRTIVAPLLMPAMATGWLLVFLFALHEVTLSSLLYGPTSQTLAVLVLNVEQVGDVGSTAALACALTALVLVPAAALSVLARRRTSPPK